MASSNRHWPSMFKSKPCNSHHQWQHDINPSLMSSGCHRAPYTSVSGCEERSPEPKPRWNPKPEQIRILEAIFNSGMVNPPRDEIRKIRAQLQEYGQVGDANVFYWFQNRKSRSKHKLRHLQSSKQQTPTPPSAATAHVTAPSSSSSSSSEKSSPKAPTRPFTVGFSNLVTEPDLNNNLNSSTSPTASANQTIFQTSHEFFAHQPFFFPVVHYQSSATTTSTSQGFCFPHSHELSSGVVLPHEVQNMGPCTSLLLNEIMNHHHHHHGVSKKDHDRHDKGLMKMDDPDLVNYTSLPPTTPSPVATHNVVVSPHHHHATSGNTTVSAPSVPVNQIQGVGEEGTVGPGGAAKTTVFINDVAFEVATGPFNVREAFGEDAVLIHSYGQPVLTNDWGVTLHSLQHGAFYYLI
ncbi:Homeodomain transcription factor [Parasponia andersonii]|uniref:Homeodomain transcription factor n=1 Tax=Parasponia andersonii TaxID=3476 RepID=A0A2P5DXB2_PARAD|nr:Homeodomain transcription factor [Parasponia andersonii]